MKPVYLVGGPLDGQEIMLQDGCTSLEVMLLDERLPRAYRPDEEVSIPVLRKSYRPVRAESRIWEWEG